MLPWAHGHQLKSIADYVAAIIEHQTACQAQLARSFGNQEAATKRLSRLLHNERLDPRLLADAVLLQALHQFPTSGKVRLAIDWTIEDKPHSTEFSGWEMQVHPDSPLRSGFAG